MAVRSGVKRELATMIALSGALCLLRGKKGAALGCAAAAGALYAGARSHDSFAGKSVLITGGSRGLGLALACRFAEEGAKVAILARDGDELAHGAMILRKHAARAEILAISCDVTDPASLEQAIRKAARLQRGLDVLVNNAGAITVGPFEATEREDFEAQMRLHLYAVIDACRLALPYLKQRRGRIVNISSVGGRVPMPHMLPYDASKFALAGFSEGLSAELAPSGVSVTTVFPTVMRTGSPLQAVFKGDHEKEFAWFAALDNLPGLSMAADAASGRIVESARRRDVELMLTTAGRARLLAAALFPETLGLVMEAIARLLPDGLSRRAKTGQESRALFDGKLFFAPLRKIEAEAAREWNQRPRHGADFNMGRH